MYSQIPISPSLRSKYSSDNQGGQRKINNADDMNTPTSPYSNSMTSRDSDGFGAFNSRNRDPESNGFRDNKFGFPHGSFKQASSNIVIGDGKGASLDASNAPTMGRFPGNPGSLALNGALNQAKPNANAPMSTLLPAFPPPPIPTLNDPSAPGGAQHHSPNNMGPAQPPSGMQSGHYLSKHFHKSSLNSNSLNISAPPSQMIPFPDGVNFYHGSSLNRKMQGNKERLEQLNISRTMIISKGGAPSSGDYLHPGSQTKSQETSRGQSSLPAGRNLASQIGIQEPNSIKNANRSNSRLPPKAPGICSDNPFKLNISRPVHNSQTSHDSPEMSIKGVENCSERSVTTGGLLKDTVRPPTAPTFFSSNKPGLGNSNSQAEPSIARPSAPSKGAAPMSQDLFCSPDHQNDSRMSQAPRQTPPNVVRPPTAPNSTSRSSLPKVDLLMNLMDKTVESKRREFEKLNKLKSALSELGDFNKKLLEENTRLRSGNNGSSGSQEGASLLSRDLQNGSMEFTKNYQTPMSDIVDLFIPNSQDPETQISSLKTIINKKNLRISELERKLSSGGGSKEEPSEQGGGILHSLLQRVKARDERLKVSLEEIEGLHINSIIDQANGCIKILAEKDFGRLKTMANDVLNQIEFNYKALSVTLDHLFEQQCSTLESIKHEGGVETQLESSNLHSTSNSKEFNPQEIDPRTSVNAVSNSPKRTPDSHHLVQKSGQDATKYKQAQDLQDHHHPKAGIEFPENKVYHQFEEPRDAELRYSYGQREERVNTFPYENRGDQLSQEGDVLPSVGDSAIEKTAQGEAFLQSQQREFDLHKGATLSKETWGRGHEHPQSPNSNIGDRGEDHSASTYKLVPQEAYSQVASGAGQQGPQSESIGNQANEYLEEVPPTVFAAYYEGSGSENNDLFSMSSPMVNTDGGGYFENHYHYQIPANYSNI